MPTTAIPNVHVELEPDVHEDITTEPNMDDVIEEDGNQVKVDEVKPPASHIHPSPNDVPPPLLVRVTISMHAPSSTPA